MLLDLFSFGALNHASVLHEETETTKLHFMIPCGWLAPWTLFSSYHAIWCLLRYRQPCSCIHCTQWEQITYPFLLACAIRYSFIGMKCLNSIYWTYYQNQFYFRMSWIMNKTNYVSGVFLDFTSLMLRRRNTTSDGFILPCCMFCSI
jgi:hypothetical protein